MINIIITTVYSRDLRYKETMMESMMKLPHDMLRQELLPYLTVDDIVKLDNACMNHKYRPQLLEKMSGVILIGDQDRYIEASLFKWLGMRRIYLINMNILFEDDDGNGDDLHNLVDMENNYVDQFRYTQHVVMNCPMRDDMAKFIISHCPCLISIDISVGKDIYMFPSSHPQVTDLTLQSIAVHCTGLQSLSLSCCMEIRDTGLIVISEHCPDLKSLKVNHCDRITDDSFTSISTHCTGLQSVNLMGYHITDAIIISIASHCTGLQSLILEWCTQITDASIISLSTHCTGLQSLNLDWCSKITDASIVSISDHCSGLESLNLECVVS
jgi:hypothetical protein